MIFSVMQVQFVDVIKKLISTEPTFRMHFIYVPAYLVLIVLLLFEQQKRFSLYTNLTEIYMMAWFIVLS
jgi:hypothetical protein